METCDAPDTLPISAGPNPTLSTVQLKKGEVGFGFNISGGQEYGTQVAIGSINEGGPADGLLKAGDEIFLVNGVEVIGATCDHVNVLVSNAELIGEVELGIHRNLARSELTEWEIKGKERIPSTYYLNYHYGIQAQRNSNTEEAPYGSDESATGNQMRKSGPKGKNVVVLKSEDVVIKGPTVFMPNTIEMAAIKKPNTGQFKTGVQISSTMTAADVEAKLKEIFTILRDETIKFYCASHKSKEGPMLLFHGVPRVWDGKFIKKNIRGNSALYILMELPGTNQIRSQVMQYSTPGSPQMICMSDSSVGHQETVEAGEPLQHFLHSATMLQFTNQELENSDHMEAMDTSQPMFTRIMNTEDKPLYTPVPSGDESALLDHSDSGHGQSDKSEERSQEDHPSVPSDADPLIRSSELQSSIYAICPPSSSLQGGIDFALILNKCLPDEIESAFALFGNVLVEVNNINGSTLMGKVPASDKPCTVTVTVLSKDRTFLGNILFQYVDHEEIFMKSLVNDPKLLQKFFMQMAEEQGKKPRECEKQPPYIVTKAGPSQAFHALAAIVFAAAKYDALEPIKIILGSSYGCAVVHAYKDSAKLPESIARDHGNDDTANYLEEVTARLYDEIVSGKDFSQKVDWLKLAKAADESQFNYYAEERYTNYLESDLIKESGYSADVESSSVSSDSESSDSERLTPTSSFEGDVENGNATRREKNHPAHTNADDAPSSFSLQECTNLPGIDDSAISIYLRLKEHLTRSLTKGRNNTPSAVKERDVTPSAERKIDFTPSAEQKSVTPSNVNESGVELSKESNLTPSAESDSNITLSSAEESDSRSSPEQESKVSSSSEEESEATLTKSKKINFPLSVEGESDATPTKSKEIYVLLSPEREKNTILVFDHGRQYKDLYTLIRWSLDWCGARGPQETVLFMPFGRKEALRPENPFKNPVGMPVVSPSNVIGKRRAKLAAEAEAKVSLMGRINEVIMPYVQKWKVICDKEREMLHLPIKSEDELMQYKNTQIVDELKSRFAPGIGRSHNIFFFQQQCLHVQISQVQNALQLRQFEALHRWMHSHMMPSPNPMDAALKGYRNVDLISKLQEIAERMILCYFEFFH